MNTHTVRDCRYVSVIVSPITANSIVFVVSCIQKEFASLKAFITHPKSLIAAYVHGMYY